MPQRTKVSQRCLKLASKKLLERLPDTITMQTNVYKMGNQYRHQIPRQLVPLTSNFTILVTIQIRTIVALQPLMQQISIPFGALSRFLFPVKAHARF